MSPMLAVHESAEIEINEAVDFYEMECRGLGNVFINIIENAIERGKRGQIYFSGNRAPSCPNLTLTQ